MIEEKGKMLGKRMIGMMNRMGDPLMEYLTTAMEEALGLMVDQALDRVMVDMATVDQDLKDRVMDDLVMVVQAMEDQAMVVQAMEDQAMVVQDMVDLAMMVQAMVMATVDHSIMNLDTEKMSMGPDLI